MNKTSPNYRIIENSSDSIELATKSKEGGRGRGGYRGISKVFYLLLVE